MSKYEVEMELTGFKLRFKGERQDFPVIADNIRNQMIALVEPATSIIEGRLSHGPQTSNGNRDSDGSARKRRKRTPGKSSSEPPTVNFTHDPARWGTPRQSWTNGQKILWMIHVASQCSGADALSGPEIADLFNLHFRQAGQLKKQNMPRDLGVLKQKSPSQLGDHADASPITWFLTEEGTKIAEKLVDEARGSAQPQ